MTKNIVLHLILMNYRTLDKVRQSILHCLQVLNESRNYVKCEITRFKTKSDFDKYKYLFSCKIDNFFLKER